MVNGMPCAWKRCCSTGKSKSMTFQPGYRDPILERLRPPPAAGLPHPGDIEFPRYQPGLCAPRGEPVPPILHQARGARVIRRRSPLLGGRSRCQGRAWTKAGITPGFRNRGVPVDATDAGAAAVLSFDAEGRADSPAHLVLPGEIQVRFVGADLSLGQHGCQVSQSVLFGARDPDGRRAIHSGLGGLLQVDLRTGEITHAGFVFEANKEAGVQAVVVDGEGLAAIQLAESTDGRLMI